VNLGLWWGTDRGVACCAAAAKARAVRGQRESYREASSEEGLSALKEGDNYVEGFGASDTSAFAALLNVRPWLNPNFIHSVL